MIHPVVLPDGRQVVFTPRSVIRRSQPRRAAYRAPSGLPPVALPIDWSNAGSLAFPMLGNDQYGDCMYVAACHLDQAMTGNVGAESSYDTSAVVSAYKKLSGGDHGLDESTIVSAWHSDGLAGNPDAKILDSLDIDVTDAGLVHSAMYLFGGVFFMLSVPSRWINHADAGSVWDAPAIPNPMNGHGTAWVGSEPDPNSPGKSRHRLLTWGTYVWITEAGVQHCDPSGFVVFSLRWFDPKTGLAPNGLSYDQLAALWATAGGKALPPNPFLDPFPHA